MLFLAAAALIGCSDSAGTDEGIQKATKKPQAPAEALPEIRYYMLSEK